MLVNNENNKNTKNYNNGNDSNNDGDKNYGDDNDDCDCDNWQPSMLPVMTKQTRVATFSFQSYSVQEVIRA